MSQPKGDGQFGVCSFQKPSPAGWWAPYHLGEAPGDSSPFPEEQGQPSLPVDITCWGTLLLPPLLRALEP